MLDYILCAHAQSLLYVFVCDIVPCILCVYVYIYLFYGGPPGDKIKRSTNNSSTNNFVSRSVIKAGTLGIFQVVRDE